MFDCLFGFCLIFGLVCTCELGLFASLFEFGFICYSDVLVSFFTICFVSCVLERFVCWLIFSACWDLDAYFTVYLDCWDLMFC